MNKKNICLVTSSMVGGGAEKLNITLKDYLESQGHKVSLIVLSSRNQEYKIELENVYFLDRFYKKTILSFLDYSMKAKALEKLISEIETNQKENFDLILASLSSTHKLFKRLKRTNVLYWIHNTLSEELKKYVDLKKYNKKIKEYKKTYQSKRIIVTSEGVKKDLIKNFALSANNINVIYNFFDFDDIKQQAEKSIPIPFETNHYLIHVGRFSKQKRHDLLFEAYIKSGTTLPLVLLCRPSTLLNELIKKYKLQNKVYVAGFQQNPYFWIKNAKALILTSDFEGFGNVIVEALILKTPVVSTDCPSGPSEILTGTYSAGLAKKNNSEDIAKKIELILHNHVNFDQNELLDKFTVENFVKKLFTLYC